MDEESRKTVAELEARGLPNLAKAIPRRCWEVADEIEGHPLRHVIGYKSSPEPAHVRLTDRSLGRICDWLKTASGKSDEGWVRGKLKKLGQDPSQASGVLAEIRAFGAMLSTSGNVVHEEVAPHSGDGKSPDFRVAKHDLYVEVCAARINGVEAMRQKQVGEEQERLREVAREAAVESRMEAGKPSRAEACRRVETVDGLGKKISLETVRASAISVPGEDGKGSTATLTMTFSGATRPGQSATKALRGKKPAGQVPVGSPGILWMDLCEPPWALRCRDADSVQVFWKGMNLASTLAVWHSFYGRRGRTPLVDRAYVGFPESSVGRTMLTFDGRFVTEREASWSAAVLRFCDGLVVFEHPEPAVPLPFDVLCWLTGLDGYCPIFSFHRYAEADTSLSQRLEDAHRRLDYFCGEPG